MRFVTLAYVSCGSSLQVTKGVNLWPASFVKEVEAMLRTAKGTGPKERMTHITLLLLVAGGVLIRTSGYTNQFITNNRIIVIRFFAQCCTCINTNDSAYYAN